MTRSELIKFVAVQAGTTKAQAQAAVDGVTQGMIQALKHGDRAEIHGFGVFRVKHRKAREGRNPLTGERVKIKAHNTVVFRPSQGLKALVR